MSNAILLVTENANLLSDVSSTLGEAGFDVVTAAREALVLILLDVTLPLNHAYHQCRELYFRGVRAPILMLSARREDRSELPERIGTLLSNIRDAAAAALAEYSFGPVRVDFANGRACRSGMPVNLSVKELQLLRYLISRRGTILTREELLAAVWGYRATMTRTLDVHIAALRQKLEDLPHQPRYIRTVRKKGYIFQDF
jgi:DNA-binding response OmpR family regulator